MGFNSGFKGLTEYISSENKARCIAALNRIVPAKFQLKFRLPVCPYSKTYNEKCLSHACPQTLEFPIKIQCIQSSVCEVLQYGISFIHTFLMKPIHSTGLIIPNLQNILSALISLNQGQKKMKGGGEVYLFLSGTLRCDEHTKKVRE